MYIETDIVRLGEVNVSALTERISAISEEAWNQNTSRQKIFPAHADTQTLWMVYDPDFRHMNPTRRDLMDEYEPLLAPTLELIAGHYANTLADKIVPEMRQQPRPGYFIRIIMTRLRAGGNITIHRDGGMSLKRCHRVHLPVITNEQCMFTSGNTTLHMRAGEVYEINNRQDHGVQNGGDAARVHIILDYVQPGEYIEDPKGPVVA